MSSLCTVCRVAVTDLSHGDANMTSQEAGYSSLECSNDLLADLFMGCEILGKTPASSGTIRWHGITKAADCDLISAWDKG